MQGLAPDVVTAATNVPSGNCEPYRWTAFVVASTQKLAFGVFNMTLDTYPSAVNGHDAGQGHEALCPLRWS